MEILFGVCDLAEPLQTAGLLYELEQNERPIDRLINSAGVATWAACVAQDGRITIPGWRNRLQAIAPRWLEHQVAARLNRTLSRS